jgi:nucleoside 2-deoxyribosyltransferase
MSKNLYFAASLKLAAEVAQHASNAQARSGGFYHVTSSWLNEPPIKAESDHLDWEKRARANEDQLDIDRSDAVVVFNLYPSTTGGMHWETGYAHGTGKPVYLVGPKTSVFHYQNHITHFLTVEAFLDACQYRELA